MITMYNMIDYESSQKMETEIEEHKALVKSSSMCRVMDFYILLTIAKFPCSILSIASVYDMYLRRMFNTKDEQDAETPCELDGSFYKCFMVNYDEIEFYYKFIVVKTIFWLVLYIICSFMLSAVVFGWKRRQKVLRSLKIRKGITSSLLYNKLINSFVLCDL